MERVKVQQAFKYPLTLDMEPFVDGRAWAGNDNSDESQVTYDTRATPTKYAQLSRCSADAVTDASIFELM